MPRAMRGKTEAHAPWTISRRKVLGGMLLGGSAAVLGPSGVSGATTSPSPVERNAALRAFAQNSSIPVRFASDSLAPDGALLTSVGGPLVSISSSAVTVVAERPLVPIAVTVAPDTRVTARGQVRQGDVSLCQLGDDVFVGTSFNSAGYRVAECIEANLVAIWAVVSSVSSTALEVETLPRAGRPSTNLAVLLGPQTNFVGSPPQVGNTVYMIATSDSPGNRELLWAHHLQVARPAS